MLALAAANHPAPAPSYLEPDHLAVAPVYNYEYGVNDGSHYGPVFSARENRDNYNTAGEYRVNLPDGRVQIVSYSAGPDGYVADVRYEGEARQPELEEELEYQQRKQYVPQYKPYKRVY